MEPGKNSSEYKMANRVMIVATVVAVLASMGKVPFTPDQAMEYLMGVGKQAGEWAKPLLALYGGVFGIYAALRTSLKKKIEEAKVPNELSD